MIFKSLETMVNGDHCLEAVAVGEFATPTAIFLDVLFYRETLRAGTYTLTAEDKAYTFDLPQVGAEVTEQGFPDVAFNVTLTLKEE
jgi:hypothetical protein